MFREDESTLGSQMGCRTEGLNVKKQKQEEKTVE